MRKLIRNAENPQCEHCGVLEIGSYVFEDPETTWCLFCSNDGDKLKDLNILLKFEHANKIKAHKARIEELEKE